MRRALRRPVGRIATRCRIAGGISGSVALGFCIVGFSASDPAWTACDRLDAARSVPRAGSVWIEAGFTTWEAFPEAMESRLRAGWEPVSGAGFTLGWESLSWDEAAAHDLEVGAVLRGKRWRSESSWGESRFGERHLARCTNRVLVALSPSVVLGGSVAFFPQAEGGAPDFEIEARSGSGPWLLGLVLHGAASEATLGIEARPHLVVFARYANDVPALGLVLDARSLLIRAEAEDHPLLGRTARVELRWSRGGT